MRFATPGGLHDLGVTGGLLEVDVRPVTVSAQYSGHQDLWEPLESGVAPSGAYVARLSPAQRTALRTELLRRLDVDDAPFGDRKSTRLNSSHANISYAVF